jgi:hypothetical protein
MVFNCTLRIGFNGCIDIYNRMRHIHCTQYGNVAQTRIGNIKSNRGQRFVRRPPDAGYRCTNLHACDNIRIFICVAIFVFNYCGGTLGGRWHVRNDWIKHIWMGITVFNANLYNNFRNIYNKTHNQKNPEKQLKK